MCFHVDLFVLGFGSLSLLAYPPVCSDGKSKLKHRRERKIVILAILEKEKKTWWS